MSKFEEDLNMINKAHPEELICLHLEIVALRLKVPEGSYANEFCY